MEESEEYKKCNICDEYIKSKALTCMYCGATVANEKIIESGNFTRVVIEAEGATYKGDIYLPDLKSRVSDIMNDDRKFVSIVNATREVGDKTLKIGFFILNKSIIHLVREDNDSPERVTSLF
jgi:hypothetical protein